MQFGNPIVGAEDLIREAIRSPNFSTDPETGVTGWRVARDGTATFHNLIVGNQNYTIDDDGNAVFSSVSATEILLDGEVLSTLLDRAARGVYAWNTLTGNSAGYTGTAIKFAEIILTDVDTARLFALGLSNVRFDTQAGVSVDRATISVYVNVNAPATSASDLAWTTQILFPTNSGVARDLYLNFVVPFNFVGVSDGDEIHFALYFSSEDTSGNLRVQGDALSVIYIEDKGMMVSAGNYDMGTGTGGEQQYITTWTGTDSDSFQYFSWNDRNVSECYQGHYSSTNGNQYSMIAFDYASIQTALSGATVELVEVYLNNNHSYFNSGITAVIGTHNQTSVGGDHPASELTDGITTEHFSKGQAKWFTVPNSIGNAFRDNTAKGLCLGPGTTNDNEYYGYFAGASQSGPPKLRITYTK